MKRCLFQGDADTDTGGHCGRRFGHIQGNRNTGMLLNYNYYTYYLHHYCYLMILVK